MSRMAAVVAMMMMAARTGGLATTTDDGALRQRSGAIHRRQGPGAVHRLAVLAGGAGVVVAHKLKPLVKSSHFHLVDNVRSGVEEGLKRFVFDVVFLRNRRSD